MYKGMPKYLNDFNIIVHYRPIEELSLPVLHKIYFYL